MKLGASIITTTVDPKLVGALADCLFDVRHHSSPLLDEPSGHVSLEMAGGRYAAGLPNDCQLFWFRRFVNESMSLDG